MEKTAASLPDDVVLEILLRIADPAALFRCATVCKRWRVLVADPSFLRLCWPEDDASFCLLGFFAQQDRWREGAPVPVFVPAPRSPLGPARRSLSLFVPEASSFLDTAVPLASRRGLLLVCLLRYGTPVVDDDIRDIRLAVCNPLAGTCDFLPPLKCSAYFGMVFYAILTGADYCSNHGQQLTPLPDYSTFFKVLIVGVDQQKLLDLQYNLCSFSSDESSWSSPIKCFKPKEHGIRGLLTHDDAVVCRGVAHWLLEGKLNYYTLDVSVQTGHVSLTKIPIRLGIFYDIGYDAPWLGVSTCGTLSMLCLRREGLGLEMWTCQNDRKSEDGIAEWRHEQMIKLKMPIQLRDNQAWCMRAGERRSVLLIRDPCKYIADLKTRAVEKISEQLYGLLESLVPFEMDWPAFFMFRLGGQ